MSSILAYLRTIGVGFFSNSSLILGVAGPGGALLAFALVGVVAVAAMEGVCEMIVLWPIPNPMVEFVRAFVDPDLAIVVGIAYWYTYAVTFSALVLEVTNLADYWHIQSVWRSISFVIVPVFLLFVNCLNVKVFGAIETIGGIIKLVMVAAVCVLMICINVGAGTGQKIGSTYFTDGIQNNPNVAESRFAAVCVSIPLATFAYLGVEQVTMTAFEAKDSENLKLPAKNITWVVTAIYIVTTVVFMVNVDWTDPNLPKYFNQGLVSLSNRLGTAKSANAPGTTQESRSDIAPVIATTRAGLGFLSGFLTACFVYSSLSTANTGLFVASRALFGLTRGIRTERDSGWFIRAIARLSSVESRTRSPWWALLLSVLVLCWLPFQRINSDYNKQELQEILVNLGSVSCVLVWSSQCFAYICYYRALGKYGPMLIGPYDKYRRSSSASHLAYFQPGLAWLGLISTLLIVFGFNSASIWHGHAIGTKVVTAYLSPVIVIIMWLALKLRHNRKNRHWGVHFKDWADLSNTLDHLDDLKANRDIHTPDESDLESRTRASSLTTTITARPPMNGNRQEPQNNSGPGDLMLLRTHGNAEGRDSVELQPVQPVPPAQPI